MLETAGGQPAGLALDLCGLAAERRQDFRCSWCAELLVSPSCTAVMWSARLSAATVFVPNQSTGQAGIAASREGAEYGQQAKTGCTGFAVHPWFRLAGPHGTGRGAGISGGFAPVMPGTPAGNGAGSRFDAIGPDPACPVLWFGTLSCCGGLAGTPVQEPHFSPPRRDLSMGIFAIIVITQRNRRPCRGLGGSGRAGAARPSAPPRKRGRG